MDFPADLQQYGIGVLVLGMAFVFGKQVVKHFIHAVETKDQQIYDLACKFNATTERHITAISSFAASLDKNTDTISRFNEGLLRRP